MFDAIVDQYEVREHVEETIARNKAAPGQLRSEWAVQMGPHVGAPPAARERGTDSGGGSGSGKGGNNDSNGPHRVFNHFHSYGGRGMGPGGQW